MGLVDTLLYAHFLLLSFDDRWASIHHVLFVLVVLLAQYTGRLLRELS